MPLFYSSDIPLARTNASEGLVSLSLNVLRKTRFLPLVQQEEQSSHKDSEVVIPGSRSKGHELSRTLRIPHQASIYRQTGLMRQKESRLISGLLRKRDHPELKNAKSLFSELISVGKSAFDLLEYLRLVLSDRGVPFHEDS